MKQSKLALSSKAQAIQVFLYANEFGSLNRYDAEIIGICHLAPRINELSRKGVVFDFVDENNIEDRFGFRHNGIRRYSINWQKMKPKAIRYFNQVINARRNND